MLDHLKQFASSWVAQLLLALLVLSFAVWGVADVFTGFGANTIAQVGSKEIPLREFQRRLDLATGILGRQVGQQLTIEQSVQFGVPSQVLSGLVGEAMLDYTAEQLGLGISNERLAQAIAEDPSLVGPDGTFNRAFLSQIIAAQRMSEDEFIVDRRSTYVRNQLAEALAGGLVAPESYLRAIHELQFEVRQVAYVTIAAQPASTVAAPTETELAAYFEANKEGFRAPEYRTVRYFSLSPATISRSEDVTDDDARRRYDAQAARFVTTERRQVEQMVFGERSEAEAAAGALASGKTFDELARERNLQPSDVDLGLVAREEIVDPAVAQAAFGLGEGAVSPVVEGRFGPVIVRVGAIEPSVMTSFEEVKNTLKAEIAAEQAAETIPALHDSIEDARAGGATLTEAAQVYELKMVTIAAVDAEGRDEAGNAIADLPGGGLAEAAFQTDLGLENDPLEPDSASYVWYEVVDVTPARERTLSEVRAQAVAGWQDAERENAMLATAEAVKSRIDDGESLAAVAADLSLTVEVAEGLNRASTPADGLSEPAISAVFEGPEGHTAIAAGSEPMTRIVLIVDEVETPPYLSGAPEMAEVEERLATDIAGDLLSLYVAQLQSDTDVRINQAAIQQMVTGVTPSQRDLPVGQN